MGVLFFTLPSNSVCKNQTCLDKTQKERYCLDQAMWS